MGKQRALSRVFFSWHRGRERDSALVSSCLSRFLGSFKSCEREFWSERLHAQTRPPIASKRPFLKEAHGIKWNDPYHWMSSPSEKAHLTEHVRRENRYADVIMADTLPLQHRLVQSAGEAGCITAKFQKEQNFQFIAGGEQKDVM